MTKDFFDVVNERTSIREYDSSAKLSKEELTELLEATVKSPSAWNLQHWHFVVITDQDAKERLLPIAYNQKQITEAGAVVAVLGDLEANKNVDDVYNPLVEAGHMTEDVKIFCRDKLTALIKTVLLPAMQRLRMLHLHL